MEEAILYKHSQAVHSSAEFSLLERKIVNILLFIALNDSNAITEDTHQIRVSALLRMIGKRTRNYTQIYQAIRNIATTLIEWGILKTDSFKGNLTGVTFLEMYNINNGVIIYRLPRELKSILVSPNQYTRLKLSSISAMTSSYGIALYENCASYMGWGDTGWISIKDFRKLMGIGEKYPLYRDLKKRVITTAVNDINKHAEFKIELLEKKEGASTSKIKFIIGVAPKREKLSSSAQHPLIGKLEKLGISKSKITQWLSKYSIEYIEEKIEYVNNYSKSQNKTGLLISALDNEYRIKNPKINLVASSPEKEHKFSELTTNLLTDWMNNLTEPLWKELCKIFLKLTENQPVLHQEFQERLFDKSFLNYANTARDVFHIAEQLIRSSYDKIAYLNPPRLPTRNEFMRQECQDKENL